MKIETQWNSGKFGLTHEAEVSEAQLPVLAAFGLKYLVQRNREHDVILGAFTTDKKQAKGEATGKGPWRRKDWKRSEVEFSEDLAKQLEVSYGSVVLSEDEEGDTESLKLVSIATKYDGGTKAEPKFQREKLKFAEKESSPAGLASWLKAFAGYEGETHTEAGEYEPAALLAAKLAIDKFLKENI